MTQLLILNAAETRAGLDPTGLLGAVRKALVAIAAGTVSAPPRIAAATPRGWLGAMPAYVQGLGLAAKLVSVFASDEPGRSTHLGAVLLFDEESGQPLALMEGSVITALRTAAAATVSMHALARPDPARVAVVGTGEQARAQAELLAATGFGGEVVIGGRDPARASQVAALVPGAQCSSIEAAVRGSDVVFCCTGATQPVIDHGWLAPGAHVSSVGGSAGCELDAGTVARGSLYVEWPGAALEPPPAGAYELQGVDPSRVRLLGSVLEEEVVPRPAGHELTVFKSTGHAALDVAAARVVYDAAIAKGSGTTVEF